MSRLFEILLAILLLAFSPALLESALAASNDGKQPSKISNSSGLSLSIFHANLVPNRLVVQFQLKNNSNSRIYVLDARDDLQDALTTSGEKLTVAEISLISACGSNIKGCVDYARDLLKMSYVEPNEFINIGISWQVNHPLAPNDQISFAVPIVARVAKDGDESNAGPPKSVIFNFPNTNIDTR